MTDTIRILAIPGSLRAHSFNRALLSAAVQRSPDGISVEIYDLHDIPPYNADVEAEGDPAEVVRLKNAIDGVDALLVSTPEYNGSISGVLKNAIDWCSRPAFASVLVDKPVSIIGATPGRSETANARADTERILNSCRASVLPAPKWGLGKAGDHISEGIVHSPEVHSSLNEVIKNLAIFVRDQSLVTAD